VSRLADLGPTCRELLPNIADHQSDFAWKECALMDGLAFKPGSVAGGSYPPPGGNHPSRGTVADALKRPTRALGRAALERTLYGLAPSGVYLALPVTRDTGGLLHHLFTLTRSRP
jgi:hypothetical protein